MQRWTNKYLYNGGSLLIDELNLGLYWTANRQYDPIIDRFQGMDKLSDMFTSVSRMVYGFNNPLIFKDKTGLSGECEDCVDLNEVVVYATKLPRVAPDYGSLMRDLGRSSSPIHRNISFTAQNEGLSQAHQLFSRGSNLHFSSGEVIKYRDSEYMRGIRAMVAYGITGSGSMVAAAASPMLIETLGPVLASRTRINMTMEATGQAGNSLLFNGNFSQMDLADIGLSAFSKYGFVGMALVDYNLSGEFSTVGNGKSTLQFGTDMLIGGFNKWHNDAMGVAGVEASVVNIFNRFNSNLTNTVGTGIKEGVKDE
ncbi:hypothetical protein [Lunatimonas lonarensis]|uniref:hypothetical protein n=1 Tax=Lunatimonas lonarensis TaxID=1232681 RepID=UPI001EE1F7FD|nr:hypothetical protein [Lunatimonas lonarensis]